MIITSVSYAVKCDRCDAVCENYDDVTHWDDESGAEENALNSDWVDLPNNKHYCPDCYEVDEETDKVIPKKPIPQYIKKVRDFLSRFYFIRLTKIEEKDDKWFLSFHKKGNFSNTPGYPIVCINELLGDKIVDYTFKEGVHIYLIK